jgi:hypothetical protein
MALIEKYMGLASTHSVDPTLSEGSVLVIKEGMLVTINSLGIRRVETATVNKVFGIAGDTNSQSASSMPGISAGWQNRVSDSFDETKASQKITVYHTGGEYGTDQFVDTNMEDAHVSNVLVASTGGLLDNTNAYANVAAAITAGRQPVAILTRSAGMYPSGVPGTDTNGDMALGGDNTDQYIEFKLLV